MNIITSDFDGSDGRTMSDVLFAAAQGGDLPVIVSFPLLKKNKIVPEILVDYRNGVLIFEKYKRSVRTSTLPVTLFGSVGEVLCWAAKHLVIDSPLLLNVTDPSVRRDRRFMMWREGNKVIIEKAVP